MTMRQLVRQAGAFFLAFASVLAWGQGYPDKPVHMVVTYPPGGASDLMGRVLGQKLGEIWKQTLIIDNKAGAAGSIGTEYAARQPADGYTFLLGNMGPSLVNPLISKVPYDMNRDFIPVSLIATGPNVLVVNSRSPYKTLAELVAAVKAKPDAFNFGSGGAGTLAQLAGEMLNHAAGLHIQHVPYKGGIAAINDVLAGQLDMIVADMQGVLQHIKSGKLRALAVTGPKRFALLPDVPTFAESGMPEIVALNSWGVYLPVGTPKSIIDPFQAALGKALADPELIRRYTELGVDTLHSTPEELRKFNAAEVVKYGRIVKEKGIRSD